MSIQLLCNSVDWRKPNKWIVLLKYATIRSDCCKNLTGWEKSARRSRDLSVYRRRSKVWKPLKSSPPSTISVAANLLWVITPPPRFCFCHFLLRSPTHYTVFATLWQISGGELHYASTGFNTRIPIGVGHKGLVEPHHYLPTVSTFWSA